MSAFVDVHHVRLRSEGGTHDPEHLVALCTNHHDMTHRGRLVIRGSFSSGFDFVRADGASTQQAVGRALRKAGAFGQAYEALRGLGFKSAEAERMLDAVRETHAGASVEAVLHAALKARPVRGYEARSERGGNRVSELRLVYGLAHSPCAATPVAPHRCAILPISRNLVVSECRESGTRPLDHCGRVVWASGG